MKKRVKKLHVNRETLRNLAERDLMGAVGGVPVSYFRCSDPCYTAADTCDCSSTETIGPGCG